MLDLLTKVVFGDFLHLGKNHSGDFLRGELLYSNAWHLNAHVWLSTLGDDVVWKPLDVTLDFLIVEFATDEALNDVNRSLRVVRCLVFSGLTNEALLVGERDERGCDSVTELIRDDLDTSILEYTDARVGSS